MQVIVEKVDENTIQIRSVGSKRPGMISLVHLVVAGTIKLGMDLDIDEMPVGKVMLIDV